MTRLRTLATRIARDFDHFNNHSRFVEDRLPIAVLFAGLCVGALRGAGLLP